MGELFSLDFYPSGAPSEVVSKCNYQNNFILILVKFLRII